MGARFEPRVGRVHLLVLNNIFQNKRSEKNFIQILYNEIISNEFKVLRWLRYLGSGAKLISPPELVEKLKASIKDLEKTYF